MLRLHQGRMCSRATPRPSTCRQGLGISAGRNSHTQGMGRSKLPGNHPDSERTMLRESPLAESEDLPYAGKTYGAERRRALSGTEKHFRRARSNIQELGSKSCHFSAGAEPAQASSPLDKLKLRCRQSARAPITVPSNRRRLQKIYDSTI